MIFQHYSFSAIQLLSMQTIKGVGNFSGSVHTSLSVGYSTSLSLARRVTKSPSEYPHFFLTSCGSQRPSLNVFCHYQPHEKVVTEQYILVCAGRVITYRCKINYVVKQVS